MVSKGKKNHGISIQVADKADPVSGPNFDRLDRKRTRSKPLKPVGFVSSRYKKSAKESLEAATKTPKDDDLENDTNIAEFGGRGIPEESEPNLYKKWVMKLVKA